MPAPSRRVHELLDACAGCLRDQTLAQRLRDTLPKLVEAETVYGVRGRSSELYLVEEAASVGTVTKQEMKQLYEGTLSRRGGNARHLYDEILASAPRGLCPLCNQRVAATLDHYLSKSRHPAFAITPLNLVPACRDCNAGTGARRPQSTAAQTLHPYFDSFDSDRWLVATLLEGTPPIAVFSVQRVPGWPASTQERVQTHFDKFGLAQLYAVHAASELVNVAADVSKSSGLGSRRALQQHLEQLSRNRRTPVVNSWQACLYLALAQSDWFCEGGYAALIAKPVPRP